MDNNTVYEWISQTTFTVSARMKSLQRIEPYLSTLVQPGDKTLDLEQHVVVDENILLDVFARSR